MSVKKRSLFFTLALVAALAMLFAFSASAFADGDTQATTATVCVEGYVINHREVAVDGTKTSIPLVVAAEGQIGMVSAEVDSDGYFEFEELPEGAWNFMLQLPENWDGIVPQAERGGIAETGVTKFAEQDACYTVVFKIRRLFDVVVVKWEELLDGSVQPGEDWDITATPIGDPFVKAKTGTTGADGRVGFTLTPGEWLFSETVKTGWVPITPSKVRLTLDQYGPGGAMDPVVFKNRQPACYGSIKVQKLGYGMDASGVTVDLGPLAGWHVTVSRADGKMLPVTKGTDGAGTATFSKLSPGVYKVQEKVQYGWEVVGDNPQTVILQDCEDATVVFKNMEVKGELTIYGRKLFKAWVPPYKGQVVGLSGWVITATLVGTDISTTAVTNALGEYEFSEAQLKQAGMGFPGATIDVCEEERENWIHVSPSCVRVTFPYPVPDDYAGKKVDFTNVQDPPLSGDGAGSIASDSSCRALIVVGRGATLGNLAAKYGTTVWEIARVNNVANVDRIYIGQQLCIP